MTGFTLRDAVPGDLAAIVRLIRGLAEYERLLHEVTVTEAALRPALFGPQPRLHAIVAENGGEAVGLALFYYTFNTFKALPNIFLEDLFVEPAHRGKGIGLALMRQLAQRAVTDGCRLVEWRVLHWNQPSIAFYERLGAKEVADWQTRQLGGDALIALAQQNAMGEQDG